MQYLGQVNKANKKNDYFAKYQDICKYICIKRTKAMEMRLPSYQTYRSTVTIINFQKMDQHTGGEWLIRDTKYHEDNQLQRILSCKKSTTVKTYIIAARSDKCHISRHGINSLGLINLSTPVVIHGFKVGLCRDVYESSIYPERVSCNSRICRRCKYTRNHWMWHKYIFAWLLWHRSQVVTLI